MQGGPTPSDVIPSPRPSDTFADSHDDEDVEDSLIASDTAMPQSACAGPRLPDLIAALAREGRALRWDAACGWYEVLDGPLFEARFDAHRRKRGKRRGDAPDRPFARMHAHFVLARGERWAGTGSAFRPKSAGCSPVPPLSSFGDFCAPPGAREWPGPSRDASLAPQPPVYAAPQQAQPAAADTMAIPPLAATAALPMFDSVHWPGRDSGSRSADDCLGPGFIAADRIGVELRSAADAAGGGEGSFRCTLQHFLDVTGAGDLFVAAAAALCRPAAPAVVPSDSSGVDSNDSSVGTSPADASAFDCCGALPGGGFEFPEALGLGGGWGLDPDDPHGRRQEAANCGGMLDGRGVAGVVGALWHEGSLGDQVRRWAAVADTRTVPRYSDHARARTPGARAGI